MTNEAFKYCFGPVLSRRIGWSLGVDVTPFKTCTYDCTYCQLGRTTNRTSRREEFVPLDDVLAEIVRKLAGGQPLDYITLVGSGEPTLYGRLAEFVAGVKALTDVPVAVITNGSLLSDPAVRAALRDADLVVPSLDAGDDAMFQEVNRPQEGIHFDEMVEGLVAFRKEFRKEIWLEVMINKGVTEAQVEAMAVIARRVQPDRIQINTAVRPPMLSDVRPLSREELDRYAAILGDKAEVVADVSRTEHEVTGEATAQQVLDLLRRHPASAEDIATYLSIEQELAEKLVGELLDAGSLEAHDREGTVHYRGKGTQTT
jgi:wyosine [tRNA(Phe)-imidazoG37] synthetase (radical SAM superfamily)